MIRILRRIFERPARFETNARISFSENDERFFSEIATSTLTSCRLTARCRTIFIDGKKTFFTVGNTYAIEFPQSESEGFDGVLRGVDYSFKEESFLLTFDTETSALYRKLKSRRARREERRKGDAG